MKKYKILISFLVFFIILSILAIGYYVLNKEEIKMGFNKQEIIEDEVENIQIQNGNKEDNEIVKKVTVGTGIKRPDNYAPSDTYYYIDSDGGYEMYALEEVINALKDEKTKESINEFIRTSRNNLQEKKNEFEEYIKTGNTIKEQIGEMFKSDYYKFLKKPESIASEPEEYIEWRCVNGYLSILISYEYQYGDYVNTSSEKDRIDHNYGPYASYCAVYDLYTGEKLSFGDLFFKGEDYSTELYEFLQLKIGEQKLGEYQKRELATISNDYESFALDKIVFNKTNLYFSEAVTMYTDYVYNIFPVLSISRDMSNIFNGITVRETTKYGKPVVTIRQLHIDGDTYITSKISYWDKEIEEKINNNIEKCTKQLIEKGVFEKSDKLEYLKEGFSYGYNSESKTFSTFILSSNHTGVSISIDVKTGKITNVKYFITQYIQTGGIRDDLVKELNIGQTDSFEEFEAVFFKALVERGLLVDVSNIANEL